MNRSCRNSQEKKSNGKKQRAEQKNSALFLYKKSVATNDSGYECRGTPLLKD